MKSSLLEKTDVLQGAENSAEHETEHKNFTVKVHPKEPKRYGYLFTKRVFDVIVSLISLILLSPLFLAVAVAIKLDSKGNAIYSQTRIGKDGVPFKFYKFRSMVDGADEQLSKIQHMNEMTGPVFKIKDDPRITKTGKFIRETSIDELPQLVNILRGEMSFIGPRPPLPREVEQYTPEQMRRLDVVGGLSCYWQISGRSRTSFEEWMELDMKYIKERSLFVDAKIFMKTFAAVINKTGAQ
ncbi:multidrug MFS transporter [Clostridia bacterium]|nr:multidrug MFS transporter [Clostridia bacterium]